MDWTDCPVRVAGDVVCTAERPHVLAPKTWVSFLIGVCTQKPKEAPTRIKHVCRMTSPTELIEAVSPRLRYSNIEKYQNPKRYDVLIARRTDLTDAEARRLNEIAAEDVGHRYAHMKLVGHALDWGLTQAWHVVSGRTNEVYAFRWLFRMPRYMMCSWTEGHAWDDIGKPFAAAPPWALQPDHIADELVSARDRWRPLFWTDDLDSYVRGGADGAA